MERIANAKLAHVMFTVEELKPRVNVKGFDILLLMIVFKNYKYLFFYEDRSIKCFDYATFKKETFA
jgi:hypothetical protein